MQTTEYINRKIIISEPITDDLAGNVIAQILAINDFDEQMSVLNTYTPEPIEMFINSGGGSATAGNAIISAMELSETPIVTYGVGIVASMALGIFISGEQHDLCTTQSHMVLTVIFVTMKTALKKLIFFKISTTIYSLIELR